MKMSTVIEFEVEMPKEEIEAFKALSPEARDKRIEGMKRDVSEWIKYQTVGETTITRFSIHFEE